MKVISDYRIWLVVLIFSVVAPGFLRAGEDFDEEVRAASNLRHKGPFNKALEKCESIIGHADAKKGHKQEAFRILIYVYLHRTRKYDKGAEACKRLRKHFAGDPEMTREVLFSMSDMLSYAKKYDESVKVLEELIQLQGDDVEAKADALHRIGNVCYQAQKWKESYAASEKSIAASIKNESRVAACLTNMQNSAWNTKDMEKCAAALVRLIDDKYLRHRGHWEHDGHRRRYGDCLVNLKRLDDARSFFSRMEKESKDLTFRQESAFRIAQTLTGDARVKAFERVFVDHSGITRYWYETQKEQTRTLQSLGKFKEALSAAKVLLDVSYDTPRIAESCHLIADLFRQIDKNIVRANSFIDYQRFGPSGKDGKIGTADDGKNPLQAVVYASYPAREKAFDAVRKEAGDGANAFYHHGMTYMYTGRPKDGLKSFAEAFRRCQGKDLQRICDAMLLIGARSVRGHAHSLDEFYSFISYGPAGKDGKPGTTDDLKDLLTPLMK